MGQDKNLRDKRQATLRMLIESALGQANPGNSDENAIDELALAAHGDRRLMQEHRQIRTLLLTLFPHVEGAQQPSPHESLQLRKENRVASPERFDQYFSYGPTADSASDAMVKEWLEAAVVCVRELPPLAGPVEEEGRVLDLFTSTQGFSEEKRADFFGRLGDMLEDLGVENFARFGELMARGVASRDVKDSEAGTLIRRMLAIVRKGRHAPLGSAKDGAFQQIEAGLHLAFASLLRTAPDPFDAAEAAGEHVNNWQRLLSSGENDELSPMLRPVLSAGLARIESACAEGRDIFVEYSPRAGGPIWRWRDLLRHQRADFKPIREYLHHLLSSNPGHLPALLGFFAGWSGDLPRLDYRNLSEVRASVEEIFGWRRLLRAVAKYRQVAYPRDPVHDPLVPELLTMLADARNSSQE